jgi:hypothetical protein
MGSAAAARLMITSVPGLVPASTTRRAVISLVTDAGERTWSTALDHSMTPSSSE